MDIMNVCYESQSTLPVEPHRQYTLTISTERAMLYVNLLFNLLSGHCSFVLAQVHSPPLKLPFAMLQCLMNRIAAETTASFQFVTSHFRVRAIANAAGTEFIRLVIRTPGNEHPFVLSAFGYRMLSRSMDVLAAIRSTMRFDERPVMPFANDLWHVVWLGVPSTLGIRCDGLVILVVVGLHRSLNGLHAVVTEIRLIHEFRTYALSAEFARAILAANPTVTHPITYQRISVGREKIYVHNDFLASVRYEGPELVVLVKQRHYHALLSMLQLAEKLENYFNYSAAVA